MKLILPRVWKLGTWTACFVKSARVKSNWSGCLLMVSFWKEHAVVPILPSLDLT